MRLPYCSDSLSHYKQFTLKPLILNISIKFKISYLSTKQQFHFYFSFPFFLILVMFFHTIKKMFIRTRVSEIFFLTNFYSYSLYVLHIVQWTILNVTLPILEKNVYCSNLNLFKEFDDNVEVDVKTRRECHTSKIFQAAK